MYRLGIILMAFTLVCCNKTDSSGPPATKFDFVNHSVDGETDPSYTYQNVSLEPQITFSFSDRIKESSIAGGIRFTAGAATTVAYSSSLQDDNKTILIIPTAPLKGFTQYKVAVTDALLSETGLPLSSTVTVTINTGMDSTDKFEQIPDEGLLSLVQEQTFKYFWDFGHPVSGLARERNTSGDVVTSGGSGFGIMAIVTAISRQFITRDEGLERMQKIVSFLNCVLLKI